MSEFIVAAASLNQTPLDWSGNKFRILKAIDLARNFGVRFLCLPELAVTGYGCEDMFLSPHLHDRAVATLQEIIPATQGLMVNIGIPFKVGERIHNTAAVVENGTLLGFTAKKELCGNGVHYEPRWFTPWERRKQIKVKIGETTVPFGDQIYQIDGTKIGFEICEDAWVENRYAVDLVSRGVTLIANPSASHFAFNKRAVVERLCREGSRLCGGIYIFANLLGCESGRTIYAGDRIIADHGAVVASGERFTFRDVELTTFNPESTAISPVQIISEFPGSTSLLGVQVTNAKLEEFSRACALGLFDYMRKAQAKGFVVSLSGGADSSAVACLVSLMFKFAVRDLGSSGFAEKLSYFKELEAVDSEQAAITKLLCCIYQSSENSSATTRQAASAVARALHATFLDLSVKEIVASYAKIVSAATQHQFSWEQDDLTLQNIQARVRSPSAWMVANLRGALLLSTSNRSEAAVGYATMDGDTSGGLSPLGGIDKAFLRRWLLWMQSQGPQGASAIPELELVTAQEPTAELRPPSAHQTDESDLMPYDVLDTIERLAIGYKQSPLVVWRTVSEMLKARFTKVEIGNFVERFFVLWSRSQWKRERLAPSFHLDEESLDPKTWCRFPILSGGFEQELQELRSAVNQPTRGQ